MNLEALRAVIAAHFPKLWLVVEAALSTILALLIEDVVNPPTLIFTGAAGGGKTTGLDSRGVSKTRRPNPSESPLPRAYPARLPNVPSNRISVNR